MNNFYALLFIALFLLGNTTGISQDIFSYPSGTNLDKSILINVDKQSYPDLAETLVRYSEYLNDEGYTTIIHQIEADTPDELRAYIKDKYDTFYPQLEGSVFVGEFPLAFSMVFYPNSNASRPVMSMEFYQDLDGEYTKLPSGQYPHLYEDHKGHVESEIWASVIPLTGLTNQERIQSIKDYFQKTFDYREKKLEHILRGHIEPIIGFQDLDVWQTQIDVFTQDHNFYTRKGNFSVTRDNSQSANSNFPDAAYSFNNELKTNSYDYAYFGGHGNYFGFAHTNPSIVIDIPWAQSNPIKPLFVTSGTCSGGKYFIIPEGSISTTFMYNNEGNVLLYSSATEDSVGGYKAEGETWRTNLMTSLENGLSWGAALLRNFQMEIDPVSLQQDRVREYYSATRIIFGDATLKLQEYMDYAGNDIPYIMDYEYKQTPINHEIVLSLDLFDIKDNDDENFQLVIHQGEDYDIIDYQTIIPKEDFSGFINVKVSIFDGKESSQISSYPIYIFQPNETCTQIRFEDYNANAEIALFKAEIEQSELNGRFYHFSSNASLDLIDGVEYININLFGRSTDSGLIKKERSYRLVDEYQTDSDCDFFFASEDCDDDNFYTNPEAIEIPNNNIDEDCDGVDAISSSVEDLDALSFRIVPNPAIDVITLELEYDSPFTVEIFNTIGKKLISLKNETQIDVSRMNPGNYILRVLSAEKSNMITSTFTITN